jgi:hypothetical protein
MHENEIQRNAFSIGNQGSDPGKEVFLLLTAKPYAASRPRRVQRPWIHTLGHRLGGMALCGLAASEMQPCQAQSNIQVQIPSSATIWSVNGVNYTGQTQQNIQGNAANSASFQVAPSDVTDIAYSISIQGVSTTLNPGTVTPSATSLAATFTNATAAAFTQSPISLTSVGGISTIGSNKFQNEGSSLTLNATGVGASVFLGRNQSNQGYLIQSEGGAGLSTSSPNEANGANGGPVTANLTTAQESDSLYSTSVLVYGFPVQTLVLPWQIPSSAIQASSIGGLGAGSSTGSGSDADWAGNGGAGGSVSVTITNQPNPPSPFGTFSIYLGTEEFPLQSDAGFSVAGILATSVGASNGPCCSWDGKQGSTITPLSDPSTVVYPIGYGLNGSGGTVDVNFSGVISGITSGLYGIVATSVGASTQLPTNLSNSSSLGPAQASGLGGDVTVNLLDGSINLGSDSVGVFAASLSDQVILPSGMSVAGTGNTAGSVQVNLDAGTAITVFSETPGQFSAGIVAVSSTGWLIQPIGDPVQGAVSAGNGGDITISNSGSIVATQNSAIGIAALSLGNGGVLTNAPSSTTSVNTVSGGNAGAAQSNSGGTVQVTNDGSVISNGNASIGILAVSNGAGGLIAGIPDAAFGASAPDANNIAIGSQASGYAAGAGDSSFTAPGGAVTITNTGSIESVGGNVAIGIVGQSVGGGGASYTEGVALFVGDAGGQGGDGGPVTLNNSGSITTEGDGSIGFLGQSIGGGGGHGANTKGLFVAVGGQGGSGGSGGSVTANLNSGSTVSTSGDFASGMLLQSIGGGGGNGGYGKAYGIFFSAGIGGAGGSGGAGGDIAITTTGSSAFQSATSGNQSHGLLLQSIGGGGGNGGHAYSLAAGAYFAGAVAVGGSGSVAGAGGNVSLCPSGGSSCSALTGSITTGGTDAVGVLLQSIGGGGGYGGGAIADAYAAGVDDEASPPVTISLAASVGGNGGQGGNAGAIGMVSGLNVATAGTGSHAIAAQAIGGGGGAAADATAGANVYDNTSYSFTAALSLGGTGGSSGAGGAINLTTLSTATPSPQISTLGHNAAAVLAQSIGGGGGYGGFGNAASNQVATGDTQYGLSFGLGGDGGSGNSGAAVNVSNGASIATFGSQSPGVLAQSIGGGGGVAGNGGAQSIGGNRNFSIAVGGSGAGGGTGGSVTVTNSGNISTGVQLDLSSNQRNNQNLFEPIVLGGDSHGIVAQSIGGGGGIGGNADPAASLIGSMQSLLNEGAGDYVNSTGLYQYFTTPSASAPINYDGQLAIGGKGGTGSDGEAVSVTHQGSQITTYGHRSYGILAQSIGGGGGIGGSSTASSSFLTGSFSAKPLTGFNLGFGINVGGSNGVGGDGGPVTIVLNSADIVTAGYASHALLAQSIGGGGGAGHDGSVYNVSGSINPAPEIVTIPSVTLGSGSSGTGGTVSVNPNLQAGTSSGNLITLGDGASGALLQSIGGGGGLASYGCTNSGNAPAPTSQSGISLPFTASACFQNTKTILLADIGFTPASFQGSQPIQNQIPTITINATSESASAGGAINFASNNLILTQGNRSIGVVAQSIGGGGGYVSAPRSQMLDVFLFGGGSNNSSGGDVTLTFGQASSGPAGVITSGTGSWGILAQSIGGGGGFISDPSLTLTQVPEANDAGNTASSTGADGGDITINLGSQNASSQPVITTNGAFAHGIVAQSIGGGGGIFSSNYEIPLVGTIGTLNPVYQGSGGTIDLNIYGTITVLSDESIGVFAQSSGTTSSSGAISINVDGSILVSAGSTSGGTTTPTGTAIMVSGGSTESSTPNTITIGSGGLVGATNTTPENTNAILANYGITNVLNNGTLNGSVDLGSTPGELTNNGTFNAGPTVVVSQNSLHNYGLMRIGAVETISRTDLKGRFVQHDTGTLELSIDSTADVKSDYLNVSGPMLLSGKVIPLTNTLLRDEIEFAAADSILLNAWVPSNFLLYDWQLRSRGNKLSIKPVADFTPDSVSLTSNQHSLATYLQRSWDQGEPSDASLFSYFHTFAPKDADNYVATLKQIGGMALNSQPIQMKTSFSTALSESLTCPTVTPEGLKPNQQHCVWARATGDYSTQASNDSNSGYWVSAPGVRLGGQRDLGHGWTAGLALGYATNYLRSDNFSSDGDFFDVAVSARKQLGNWELGGSLAFAQGWFENSRTVVLPARGFAAQMGGDYSSDSSLSMLGLRLRAAYNHQAGNHQFKPYLDVDLSQSWMPAYRESTGDLSLQSSGSSDFNVAITPMVEYTLYSTGKGGSGFKAFVSAGASWLPDNRVTTPMSFRADQLDNGSFDVVTDGPTLLGRLNVGAEASISENLEVRAEYNLQVGGGYRSQGISANLRYRF